MLTKARQKLTLELKGKLLDMEEKARALEVAYKTRIASFIESVEPFVDRLRGESGEDALRDMFLQQLRILAEGKGDSNVVPSENPIQRQARLEALTSAIREQRVSRVMHVLVIVGFLTMVQFF